MEIYSDLNKTKKQKEQSASLYTEYKPELQRIQDYLSQLENFSKESDKKTIYEKIADIAEGIDNVAFRIKAIKSICSKVGVPFKIIKPYVEEYTDDFVPIIYEEENYRIIFKSGNNRTIIAENFLIYLKYRLEDEDENVKWVLEVAQRDVEDVLTLEVSNDDFSNSRKMKTLFLSKKLSLIISDAQLSQLHSFLLGQELKDTRKIIRMGYDDVTNTYVFSNGVYYNGNFAEPNENGITEIEDKVVAMPIFNKKIATKYWFRYIPDTNSITIQDYIENFNIAHGAKVAIPSLCHYFFSIYRDVLVDKLGFSPILFLKGVAGSGKSAIAKNLLTLFGVPPREGNANLKSKVTEAALSRTMSAYSNCPLWLDEYHPDTPLEGFIQASYDNSGLKKAKMSASGGYDTGMQVDDTALKTTLILTSNYFPKDEPIFTRFVYIAVNQTKREEFQIAAFRKIFHFEDKGLSWITCFFQQYRDVVQKNFYKVYIVIQKKIKANIRETNVNDRLIANQAAIIAPLLIVNEVYPLFNDPNIELYLINIAVKQIEVQHHAINNNSPIRNYFDILQILYGEQRLKRGVHFKVEPTHKDRTQDYLILRYDTIWPMFKDRYMRQYNRQSPDSGSIQNDFMKLLNLQDVSHVFSNYTFNGTVNDSEREYSTKKNIILPYTQIQDEFGIEFNLH